MAKANPTEKANSSKAWFARKKVGSTLTLGAFLGFFFTCMTLPLVGPAGAMTSHYTANFMTFLAIVGVSLALAVMGLLSKMQRRQMDGSPFPKVSLGLTVFYILLLGCLLTGLLKI